MTQVAGNQYKVEKLPDSDAGVVGQPVYAKPEKADKLLLSLLPRGAKIQIGDKKGKWGKIDKLLVGKVYPSLPKDDDGNLQGWIDLTHLKAVVKPLIMDEVKVLEIPYPVKAGELMGYPGIYQGLSAAEQTMDSPLLVHLEVFTPEEMPAFIELTKTRAVQQIEDKKALLKVNRDAVLYHASTAEKEIATDVQVAKVAESRAKGKWLEVKKQRIGVIDKKYLSAYRSLSRKPIKAEYTIGAEHKQSVADALNIDLMEVPDKVFFYGECLNRLGARVTTVSPDKTHPLREIHFTPENDSASYWIEANKLDAKGKKIDPNQRISAWMKHPLQMDNKQAGKVYFEQVFAKSEIEETEHWASDAEGSFWWQLKTGNKDSVIGTDSFAEVEGWVKCAAPAVTRHHPWEWPLFHTLQETATPAQELERNHRLRLDPADRTELMQALYKILGGTMRQVADSEEQEDTGLLKAENLKTALRYPWLSQQFSHLIVNYESEWFADKALSKWHQLDEMLKKYLCLPQSEAETAEAYKKRLEIELAPWQAEKEQRIKKLLWWDDVAGKHGFPVDAKVWHFHPVGMLSITIDLDKIIREIGDIISHGEGNYESYNTGTKGVDGGKVGFSFVNPPPGTVTGKTINEILETDALSGTNVNRMFATGKYQTVIRTLRSAKLKMKLTGDELYDSEMQERVFREYLIDKAGQGALGLFVKERVGTLNAAQLAAAKEWASIAAPSGETISDGRVSDGTLSYYESAANFANQQSTIRLREKLLEIWSPQ
ncbi:hypothetical protein [Serratia sp. (in: enterobacteria)]|uniref:hypothetical protein n=1 Tax=Serratia sp. (in: enterobacteria) TaxID=616 RepID=UPI003989BFDC